ncbi:L-histidine N(alpha)-methyltransferase [Thermophagus sp. OGC60D27]|uniref:L-histidine N(alpha)-methyltransferase n=1 Tax=Thermophagus sp. OGC60D27 TaxID=3458415 RepID=UPI004038490F
MEPKLLLSQLAADTLTGLSATPKYLLSKYFYDDRGSRIFQDIMNMPEYYLTDCELEIFSSQKETIIQAIRPPNKMFNLVELGSGDGLKTKILLQHLMDKSIHFQYTTIDISAKANRELVKKIQTELPGLNVAAKTGDFFHAMNYLNGADILPKTTLFLGSNIGNFSDQETELFLNQISAFSKKGDKVLIGFDLKKSPHVIMRAYNDPHGLTRRFNLNYLERLNRELHADFDLKHFEQHTAYNPISGEVKSFLVSTIDQTVNVGALEKSFHFYRWESIFMERSRKYDFQTIKALAANHRFKVIRNFTDHRNYFVDSLWTKI